MTTTIIPQTAEKWFTCPDWCTLAHKFDAGDVTAEGLPQVNHDAEIHDGPSVCLHKGRTDTLTADGIRTEDYYTVGILDGEPAQVLASSRRIVAADLRLIASIIEGE